MLAAPPRRRIHTQVRLAAECEIELDPLFHRRQPKALQPPRLATGKRLLAALRKRRPTPQAERLAQHGWRTRRTCRPRLGNGQFEPKQVDRIPLHLEEVARWPCEKHPLA